MSFYLKYIFLTFVIIGSSTSWGQTSVIQNLVELETASDGHMGISAINTANNQHIQYRANERFPLCSTAKVFSVAAVLQKTSVDKDLLQQKVTYKKTDLVTWSPITEKNILSGMTVSELCNAAITQSDNSAINFLIKKMGGLTQLHTFIVSLGDNTSRVDRVEPDLSLSKPGDLRDTSTPAIMAEDLKKLTLGDALTSTQRQQLINWLKANTTGNKRIRAGTPKNWIVGDKTGTGSNYGTTNDIAIIWPPKCAPIVLAIYYKGNQESATKKEDALASATRLVIDELTKHDPCLKIT